MAYSKLDLLNDINDLVERYITQEIAAHFPDEEDAEILVEPDEDGDMIDLNTGNIWNIDTQEIIGSKDLKTGIKTKLRGCWKSD